MVSILVRLIVGLLRSAIAFLWKCSIRFLWTGKIRLLIEDKLDADVSLNGTWKLYASLRGIGNVVFIWTPQRTGHKIGGYCQGIEGPDQGLRFDVEGTFRNGMIIATYKSQDKTSLMCGTFSLMVFNNANTMKGYVTYYDENIHKLRSTPLRCEKLKPSQALA